MSRVQDQGGRKIRLLGQGVTEIKPSGLLAVRTPQSNHQKAKEGIHQCQQKLHPTGCMISTEMVKALKNALMDASSVYHGQKELSKKTVCSKSRLHQKNPTPLSACAQIKCPPSNPNKANQKKTTVNHTCTGNAKKKLSNVTTKMELITRMNMEGVVEPKYNDVDQTNPPIKHRPPYETKKKTEVPPTRRGPREARRKPLIAVPASSPERGKVPSSRVSQQVNGPTAKNSTHVSSSLENRKQLATMSLDRLVLSRRKEMKSSRIEKIEPDMTSYDFMRKLMSYSNMGFRETRYDRRMARGPKLDTIPEEF